MQANGGQIAGSLTTDCEQVMPYPHKSHLLLLVAEVIVLLVAFRWLTPFGLLGSIALAVIFTYLTILFGRWRKGL